MKGRREVEPQDVSGGASKHKGREAEPQDVSGGASKHEGERWNVGTEHMMQMRQRKW